MKNKQRSNIDSETSNLSKARPMISEGALNQLHELYKTSNDEVVVEKRAESESESEWLTSFLHTESTQ